MKVLITGVAGFVGGHLLDFLGQEHPGTEVFGMVRPHGIAPAEVAAEVRLVEADLDDAASVEAAIDQVRPDRVVHLAGQSSPHLSWLDPGATLRTNLLGLVHLLDAVRTVRLRPRVLVVGSAEEYGSVKAGDLPLREDAPLRPLSPYAVSKVAQGLLALQYVHPDGIEVVRTRTFHHTGPRRGEAFAESSFARQLAEVEAGLRPPVLAVGNLEAVRDYSDVRDVVRAYWALLERGSTGEVYNVCSGTGLRIGELLERLILITGLRPEVRQDPARLRPTDVPALVGDHGKLRAATGWQPRIPLERTLRDLVDYWRERVAGRRPASQ